MAPKTPKSTDIVTLADLAPRRPVVGGSERRVFGATAHPADEKSMTTRKKDLPAKKTVNGGKITRNDSLTLIRAAAAVKKDLPSKKTVKGGKIAKNDSLTLVRDSRR